MDATVAVDDAQVVSVHHVVHLLDDLRVTFYHLSPAIPSDSVCVVFLAEDWGSGDGKLLRTGWLRNALLDTDVGEVVLCDDLVHLWRDRRYIIRVVARLDGHGGLISRCKCHLS